MTNPERGFGSKNAFPRHLEAGDTFKLTGNGGAATLNLLTEGYETVLHFNPRQGQNCVVRKSKYKGKFGGEERSGGYPFSGDRWSFELLMSDTGVTMYVGDDRKEFGTWANRNGHRASSITHFNYYAHEAQQTKPRDITYTLVPNKPFQSNIKNYMWSNRASVEWSLTRQGNSDMFDVGVECPYYKDGHTVAEIEIDKLGDIQFIKGPWGEKYDFANKPNNIFV